ncbi:unnamed protein product, partial [Choristocarpus tenellus]
MSFQEVTPSDTGQPQGGWELLLLFRGWEVDRFWAWLSLQREQQSQCL